MNLTMGRWPTSLEYWVSEVAIRKEAAAQDLATEQEVDVVVVAMESEI